MNFDIATADALHITDQELADLLTQVYVAGGFTEQNEAIERFDPAAVRARGIIIGARDKANATLAGMIILVPANSPARRLAQANQAELHLMGVRPEYRRRGLGKALLDAALAQAKQAGYTKVILWTQVLMTSAQKLYEKTGFMHVNTITRNNREFKVYEKVL